MPSDRPKPSEVRWAETVPPPAHPPAAWVCIKPGDPQTFQILSRRITMVWTHFVFGYTQPCRGDACCCLSMEPRPSRRLYGYLVAARQGWKGLWLPEMTMGALQACPSLTQASLDLRGRMLTLRRRGQSKRSGLIAALGEVRPLRANAPDPDTREILCLIWGGAFAEHRLDTPGSATKVDPAASVPARRFLSNTHTQWSDYVPY